MDNRTTSDSRTPGQADQMARLTRQFGAMSLIGIIIFTATCVATQLLRPDLNWAHDPISDYLTNAYGAWLRAAYYVMAAALILLAVGKYLALPEHARSAAPLLLFVAAAMALCLTALAKVDVPPYDARLHRLVHSLSAKAAFLCVTVAMMLQAWHLRGDGRYRSWFRPMFAGAVVCFVAMWVKALFLGGMLHGLTEKLLILLIVLWLSTASWLLWRGPGIRCRHGVGDDFPG